MRRQNKEYTLSDQSVFQKFQDFVILSKSFTTLIFVFSRIALVIDVFMTIQKNTNLFALEKHGVNKIAQTLEP